MSRLRAPVVTRLRAPVVSRLRAPVVTRLRAPVAALLAATAAPSCGGVPDGNPLPEVAEVSRATGPRFDVVCHFPCAGSAGEALAVADLAARFAGEYFGPPDTPSRPAAIRLYRTEAFRAVSAALARDELEEGAAFSSPQRRSAYVELIPPVDEARLSRAGLPNPTLRLIAHEAAHLTFYAAAGGPPRLPDWLSEGAALAVERTVARELGLFPGTADPRVTAQVWRSWSLMRTGALPSLATILSEGPDVARDRADYAVRALAFEYLRDRHPDLLDALLEIAGRRIGAADLPDSLAAVALGRLGTPGAIEALDSSFRRVVAARADGSRWLQVRGIPRGRPLHHAGLPRGRVTVLARDPWRADAVEVAGDLARHGGSEASGEMGLVLARSGGAQILVGFDPARGSVRAWRERGRGGIVTATSEIARAAVDLPARSRVTALLTPVPDSGAAALLEVRVGEAAVVRARVEDVHGRGDWGVFADPGAAGVWEALRVGTPRSR